MGKSRSDNSDPTKSMNPDDQLRNLRINALATHQASIGHGDDLVQILKRAVHQLERTHSRVQSMSTILFVAGLAMLAAGVYQVILGRQGQEAWAALLGGIGGVTSIATIFWTGPLRQMSESVANLVKLETAFLGYIRIIGEADSGFQMQYLDILAGSKTSLSLDKVTFDTTRQVREAMEDTLAMIDKHVSGKGDALKALEERLAALEKRLQTMEGVALKPSTAHQ